MDLLLKILVILLLIECIVIVTMQFNTLKKAVLKELFNNSKYLTPGDDFGAATIESVVQGDMKSTGGMSGLDNLDGTGTGPIMDFQPNAVKSPPFPDADAGKADGSYAPGPDGGYLSGDGGGSGPDKSAYLFGGGPIPNLPNKTFGLIPNQPPTMEQVGHDTHTYTATPNGLHGEIDKSYTYYYLAGDNINKPCELEKECLPAKCGPSGFCKY